MVSMIPGRIIVRMMIMDTTAKPSTNSGYVAADRIFSRMSRSRSAKSAAKKEFGRVVQTPITPQKLAKIVNAVSAAPALTWPSAANRAA